MFIPMNLDHNSDPLVTLALTKRLRGIDYYGEVDVNIAYVSLACTWAIDYYQTPADIDAGP
jgi:hypothetical protein